MLLEVVPPQSPANLVGDGNRLQQVLWNLLSNAVKFTPRDGRVVVRWRQQDLRVFIEVSDTGQGISADFLPRVFDRFTQADSQKRRARTGLGLGLALVREMVQAHGGTVAADSPGEGHGSTFVVALPVSTAATKAGMENMNLAEADSVESLPRLDILIVDDDGDVRDLLALLLESRGAVARTVSSAAEALAAIAQRRPDLLLADLRMPEEDGYSLIRKLRDRDRAHGQQRLSAIAVTAYASPSDREQAIEAGYDGHVAKPIDPEVLVRAIAQVANPDSV